MTTDDARGSGHTTEPGGDGPGAEPPRSPGADLARQALDAARARNAGVRRRTASYSAGKNRGSSSQQGNPGAGARRLKRRRWSGPGADRARDPQPVGETLRTWLAKSGAGREVTKASLMARWPEIVGPEIADHAVPLSLVDGQLLIQAESTAWATQLRLMARRITQRVNGELGRGTVARIRVQGPAAPSWRFGDRHVPGRGPRDTYG